MPDGVGDGSVVGAGSAVWERGRSVANSRSGESVLQRAVRILDAFTVAHPWRTGSELAREAGLSTSTAHRLAMDMVDVGLLDRSTDGRFSVGRRAWELTARGHPLEELRHRAQPVLEGVHSAVREYVSLAVPDFEAGTVLYLERVDRLGEAEILAEQAGRLDLHSTSSGLVMLAHAERTDRERVLARELNDYRSAAPVELPRLRQDLALIRRRGFVRIVGGMVEENTSYAVPVLGAGNRLVGALSVVARTGAVDEHVVLPVLVAGGRTLSRELGAVAAPAGGERPWIREVRGPADPG